MFTRIGLFLVLATYLLAHPSPAAAETWCFSARDSDANGEIWLVGSCTSAASKDDLTRYVQSRGRGGWQGLYPDFTGQPDGTLRMFNPLEKLGVVLTCEAGTYYAAQKGYPRNGGPGTVGLSCGHATAKEAAEAAVASCKKQGRKCEIQESGFVRYDDGKTIGGVSQSGFDKVFTPCTNLRDC